MQIALYDLPDTYFSDYVAAIEAVTPEAATAAASRHLNPDRLTTLIVDDVDAIRPGLLDAGLGEPVVLPADTF